MVTEPENHTLHLLRDIRAAIADLAAKHDRDHADLSGRLDHFVQILAGEIATSRYAFASVDARFAALEGRVAVLETDR